MAGLLRERIYRDGNVFCKSCQLLVECQSHVDAFIVDDSGISCDTVSLMYDELSRGEEVNEWQFPLLLPFRFDRYPRY